MRHALAIAVVAGCAAAPAPPQWPVPAGWRSEVIPFPLDFAPSLAHRGVEELRFPPGMFDPASPARWSYAFAWRLDDAAALAPGALAVELTAYFKGLVAAVDTKHRVAAPDQIAVAVDASFAIRAHVFDAFATAEPVDLEGQATRIPCGTGAVWIIWLAPRTSAIRAQLAELARGARCGQRVVR